MSFKLLAIRPLKGCDKRFLRVLKEEELYSFYNNYEFQFKANDVVGIKLAEKEGELNLYDIEITSGKKIEVNISAIVGKNGSGKSSIIELLYATLFNIAYKANLLPDENDEGEPIDFEEGLRVEIYYLINDFFYLVRLYDEDLSLKNLTNGKAKKIYKQTYSSDELFYTIAINYSHYALNSEHLGSWVKNIFHKNDGYQTPLVLNPFRKRGNIDINEEEHLTKARLLANIISPKSERGSFWINKRRTLIPNKVAESIKFEIDSQKVQKINKDLVDNTLLDKHYTLIIDAIYKHLIYNEKQHYKQSFELDFINKYLVVKLFNISEKYSPYKDDFRFLESDGVNEVKLIECLKKLKNETSHIAFKLHQVVNFIQNADFIIKGIGTWMPLKRLNEHINDIEKEDGMLINYLPPSLFTYDLRFKGDDETLDTLSSGEKQRIFSSSTYKYHLYNLDSVTDSPFKVYENINIIFDEIELYYHPEFQKNFVSDFLESLKTLQLKRIKSINCIMVTHSPFILSDIPISNTLKLKNGLPDKEVDKQTFGANIHDLLANDFFMSDGFMGEWAKNKIKIVAEHLTYIVKNKRLIELEEEYKEQEGLQKEFKEKDDEILQTIKRKIDKLQNEINELKKHKLSLKECKDLISIVGEPVLYNSLIELYIEVNSNGDDSFIDAQIEKLKQLKKKK